MRRSDFLSVLIAPLAAPLLGPDRRPFVRCPRCRWRRTPGMVDGRDPQRVVRCPCQCEVVCLGCGRVDLPHFLGPWYYDERLARPMHRMNIVHAGHRCPDGGRSPGQRRLHAGEGAPGPLEGIA